MPRGFRLTLFLTVAGFLCYAYWLRSWVVRRHRLSRHAIVSKLHAKAPVELVLPTPVGELGQAAVSSTLRPNLTLLEQFEFPPLSPHVRQAFDVEARFAAPLPLSTQSIAHARTSRSANWLRSALAGPHLKHQPVSLCVVIPQFPRAHGHLYANDTIHKLYHHLPHSSGHSLLLFLTHHLPTDQRTIPAAVLDKLPRHLHPDPNIVQVWRRRLAGLDDFVKIVYRAQEYPQVRNLTIFQQAIERFLHGHHDCGNTTCGQWTQQATWSRRLMRHPSIFGIPVKRRREPSGNSEANDRQSTPAPITSTKKPSMDAGNLWRFHHFGSIRKLKPLKGFWGTGGIDDGGRSAMEQAIANLDYVSPRTIAQRRKRAAMIVKESLDMAYALNLGVKSGKDVVVFLEDDVQVTSLFVAKVQKLVDELTARDPNWFALNLYHPETWWEPPGHLDKSWFGCCTQGLVFRNSPQLEHFVRTLERKDRLGCMEPDVVLGDITTRCLPELFSMYGTTPSLVQHVGRADSTIFNDANFHRSRSFVE